MPFKLIFLAVLMLSCASQPRQPAAVVSEVPKEGALMLEQALTQGLAPTLAYLKGTLSAEGYPGMELTDPAENLPRSLLAGRPAPLSAEKKQQQRFLAQFRSWRLPRKLHKAGELLAQFDCERFIESQALGFSLELDFPEEEAVTQALALHEKVLSCDEAPRNESFFRLAIFHIQKGECAKALSYLERFPPSAAQGARDRLAYVRSLCPDSPKITSRNPWSGYGILLTDPEKIEAPLTPWFLSAKSGSEEWDRLLATLLSLSEQGQTAKLQYLAGKLNYAEFRNLPLSFQTSVLVLLHFANADLPVFQTLHRFLADHPETVSPAVRDLLFPTRYWEEIVENTQKTDPILVKALIRQESAFNPLARSRVRASGLMQLIYPTARAFGVKQKSQLFEPEVNIRAGSAFLGRLIEDFGSVELALAAYNAGPGLVRQWQRRYPTTNINLFVEMIPYSETREYVRLVQRNYRIYQTILAKPQVLGTHTHEQVP